MMLEWLGRRHACRDMVRAAERIDRTVAHVLAEGKTKPVDQGGSATPAEVGDAVAAAVSAGA